MGFPDKCPEALLLEGRRFQWKEGRLSAVIGKKASQLQLAYLAISGAAQASGSKWGREISFAAVVENWIKRVVAIDAPGRKDNAGGRTTRPHAVARGASA
jgi:hypothetical protein